MNCTVRFLQGLDVYSVAQTAILSLCVIVIATLNIFALFMTVVSNRKASTSCPITRLFISSYIGNILGGVSLLVNEIVYTEHGIPQRGCQENYNNFFFFYFGLAINMVVVVLNTYVRYRKITSLERTPALYTHKYIILWYGVPTWLFSLSIAVLYTLLQIKHRLRQFNLCLSISGPSLIVAIVWNVLLNKFLQKSKRNARTVGQKSSEAKVTKAQSFIQMTIAAHFVFLVIGTIAVTVSTNIDTHTKTGSVVFVVCTWIIRLMYITMFSVEAQVYFLKHPFKKREITEFFSKKNSKDEPPVTIEQCWYQETV